MFEGVPRKVQEKFEFAIQRIEVILAETNAAIAELAETEDDLKWPDDYELIGSTIYYNDPAIDLVFRYATTILPDLPGGLAQNSEHTGGSSEISSNTNLQASYLTAQCNYGQCCDDKPGKSCKKIPSPGDENGRKCGRNRRC